LKAIIIKKGKSEPYLLDGMVLKVGNHEEEELINPIPSANIIIFSF